MTMRRLVAAILCAGLLVSTSFAQGEGRKRGGGGGGQPPRGGQFGGGMGMGMTALAKDKGIAADLKLSEDQVKKVEDLDKKMADKRQEMMREMRESGGGFEGMREKMQEMTKTTEKELAGIISADQVKRLKQLQLQASEKTAGLMAALGNPEVADKLGFNAEQKEQLQGFRDDMQKSMREIFQDAQGDREGAQKKMADYRASMDKKVAKLLSDDQKAKWKEMLGEPYKGEFPRPQMGARRPG